ncbi:MAG: DUF6797 domain-containing protein [Akkermansiaceae bacterium]
MKNLTLLSALAALLVQPVSAKSKWFEEMEIGPFWMNTFGHYMEGKKRVDAIKGFSIDLGDNWRALYDTETLRLVTVYNGGIEWGGTPWTGQHGKIITMANKDALVVTSGISGWADAEGSFEDKRAIPGHGNMGHGTFTGHYRHGREIVLEYEVNGTGVLEHLARKDGAVTRSFEFGDRASELLFVVADESGTFKVTDGGKSAVSESGLKVSATDGLVLLADSDNGRRLLGKVAKGNGDLVASISYSKGGAKGTVLKPDFDKLTAGGAGIWKEVLTTEGKVSTKKDQPYVTDVLTLPEDNPWKSNLRFGGFDFIDKDSAALSSWNGDVWIVRGLEGDWKELKWQRIASGLFETLGLKVVDGQIYVNGRDQITKLIDLNEDGEIDYFKVFNRDVYVSANFHEFAFDLQTDAEGNFYFSKGGPVRGGGRNFEKILPHHGIVAKVSKDGKKFEVLATGLRAPGGVGIGPDGQITTGENEGTWQPCCKINFLPTNEIPSFFGTEQTRQSLKDAPYREPLVYLPMDVDNSGGSQIWIPKYANFGLKTGELLHLSYGKSSIYRVLPVTRSGKLQGGVVKMPISLQSSAMRARFHGDGSMYVLGFRGWQTNAANKCAFQRIRYNEDAGPILLPNKLEYTDQGVKISFPVKLDEELAEDPTSFSVQRWDYVRGPQYGSGEFSVDKVDKEARELALKKESKKFRNRDTAKVESAKLSSDGMTVELKIEGMKPSMSLKVGYDLEDLDGEVLNSEVHMTVYGD